MRTVLTLILSSLCLVAIGCGPEKRDNSCIGEADCMSGPCESGEKRECYTGSKDSLGVGAVSYTHLTLPTILRV